MARFQGNTHAGSDRASATLLVAVLLVALLIGAWWALNPVGFELAIDRLLEAAPNR